MWALKPPRRPAKKKINQETPERTPPEPDAAPEQALPPQSAWNGSETTDGVDSLLSLGGAYTEARRAGRLRFCFKVRWVHGVPRGASGVIWYFTWDTRGASLGESAYRLPY